MISPAPPVSSSLPGSLLAAPPLGTAQDIALPRFRWRYVTLIGCMLMGYALDGRAFAYLGYPPLFVAEMMLLAGMVIFATTRQWRPLLASPRVWPLLALCAWGLLQTVPYFSIYGMASARDAVVWGYSGFAFVLAILILEQPTVLVHLVRLYQRFIKIFLVGIPIVFLIYRFLKDSLPMLPGTDVTIFQVKEGDVLVHLAGIIAFWVAGLGGAIGAGWVFLLTCDAGTMGVINRAGMVSFLAVFGMCLLLKPLHPLARRAMFAIVCVLIGLWITDIRVPVPGGKGREVSFQQFVTNIDSVLFSTGSDGLDSTKEWRLDWWKKIVHYTIDGQYFWTGKGFGINLADDDGFQVMADNSLRAHSVHIAMLARGGVPMLALWVLAQGSWAAGMMMAFLRSRWAGLRQWEGVFFFLLASWTALLINGSFDVFIEGPMGGTWFWSIYGAGLGAMLVYRRNPNLFNTILMTGPNRSDQSRVAPCAEGNS